MTKHYFKTQQAGYGMVCAAEPLADLDTFDREEKALRRVHGKGRYLQDMKRMWTGLLDAGGRTLEYSILEKNDLPDYLLFCMWGCASRTSLEREADFLMATFMLTELESDRKEYSHALGLFR